MLKQNVPWIPVFDEASDAAEAAAATKAAEAEAAAKKLKEKAFTQEDVNAAVAKERRELQTKQNETIQELEALKARADMTAQERNDLETRIEKMKEANMTAEELARSKAKATTTEHTEQVNSLTTDRDSWKNKYTSETISRSIIDASVEHKAIVPDQIIAILQPKTQLEEVMTEEGKGTGTYTPKVDFEIIDDEGQTKILKLTVSEAVKKMREIEKYQNLFVIEGSGGMGQYNQQGAQGGGNLDIKKISQDAAAYRKARKEGKL